MTPEPPPALATGTYATGTKIGLGKTASWDYPYCILRKSWTCVQYNSQDPITGALTQALSVPEEGYDADYFWPAWSEKVDYGQKETTPWCGWTVSYNGLYYQPSIWLSSAQRGVNPAEAVCTVGQEANWRYQYGVNASPRKVLKNQSHSIRAWECKGSYLEYNRWEDPYYFFNAYNPETGEYRHAFFPYSFLEEVQKPDQIGGTGYGWYYETYYPTTYGLREAKSKASPWTTDPGRTILELDSGNPEGTEPIGFDPLSGAMPTKGILEKNPYTLTGATYPGGMDVGNFIPEGCSAKLWYQKGINRYYEEPKGKDGTEGRYRFEVSSSLMPEGKGYILDYLGGWWQTQGMTHYVWDYGIGSPTTINQTYYYSTSGKKGFFVTVQHPVFLTRKVKVWFVDTKEVVTYRKKSTGPDPNSYTWELQEASRNKRYSSQTLSWTKSNEPANLGGSDAAGKYFWENSAHQISSFTYKYVSQSFADRPDWTSFSHDYSGIQQWLDD